MDDLQKKLKSCLKEVRRKARIGERRAWANNVLFRGEGVNACSDVGRKSIAKAFLISLEHRQRHNRACIDFQRYYFYIAKNGRLAYVVRQKAYTLIKRGKIVDFEATEEIKCGIYVSHRRIINAFERDRRRLTLDVKQVLEEFFDEQLPCRMVIDTNFKLAYDPDYHDSTSTDGDLANGESCMSERGSEAEEFYGGIHGCKVARFETSDGQQVGRCIVYEYNGKRHFIRIYGRGKYHRTMLNLVKDNMKPEDLFGRSYIIDGMELETDWDDDTPNMYLDGNGYGISNTPDGWVVTTKYDYDAKSTSDETIGYVYEACYYTCDHCGARVHRDDAYCIEDYTYCDSDCASNDGWRWCERCEEHFHEDDNDAVWVNDCGFCCESCAERAGYKKCPSCGEWKYEDDMFSSEDGAVCMCDLCIEDNEAYELDDDNYIVLKKEYRGGDDV